MLVRLALRNLLRNKRRSAITALAVALGLALLVLSSAATDGMTTSMVRVGVGALAGHVVVQGPGWQEQREQRIVVPDAPEVARRLGEAVPRARIVQRVFLEGLLTAPGGAVGVAVTGVQPDVEAAVATLDDHVVEGAYLDGAGHGIVVGTGLARNLGVGLGDKVVLMSAAPDGQIESRMFRIRGLFSFGVEEMDSAYAQIELGEAQELLGLGTAATQVSAHLPNERDTRRAAADAREAFAGEPLEVLPWQEALPDLAQYVHKEQTDLVVVFPVIWAIVALGIVNTVLMSVLERTRELGLMLALGASPRRIGGLVLTEAALLGLAASALGSGLGLLVCWPLATKGLDLSALVGGGPIETAGIARDLVIHAAPDPVDIGLFALGAWGLTVLAAAWPAFKAARLRPIDGLRHG